MNVGIAISIIHDVRFWTNLCYLLDANGIKGPLILHIYDLMI